MRKLLSLVFLVVFLGIAIPAQAQLRENVRQQDAGTQVYGQEGPVFSLNQLFSPNHFQMNHSYEMSFGSFGGTSSSLGMYTNTMRFQFNSQLAARVDMAYAFTPFGQSGFGQSSDAGRMFLRNAEVAYRPSENVQLHLQIRQSPYGSYMNPYGYSPYGYGRRSMVTPFAYDRGGDLFWNENLR